LFYYVYKITNLVNNKFYIGMHQTQNLDDGYMGSSKKLKFDIELFGLDKFKKEILFNFDNFEDMRLCEKRIVNAEFVDRIDTYNLNVGGGMAYHYINKHKLNNICGQCYIVSRKLKACPIYRKWYSDQVKAGLKKVNFQHNTFSNKTHSEETKMKMSLNAKLTNKSKGEKIHNLARCG